MRKGVAGQRLDSQVAFVCKRRCSRQFATVDEIRCCQVVGLGGFEPPTCRRGDRSIQLRMISDGSSSRELHSIQLIPASSCFQILFHSYSFGACRKRFVMDESPRNTVLGSLGFPGVVLTNTNIQILTRADISSARCFAAQNVDHVSMRHVKSSMPLRCNRIGLKGFEPSTSWSRTKRSIQAELQPADMAVHVTLAGGASPTSCGT